MKLLKPLVLVATFLSAALARNNGGNGKNSSKGKSSGKGKGSLLKKVDWMTLLSEFAFGSHVIFQDKSLQVVLRCQADEIDIDFVVTNDGDATLTCYGEGEDPGTFLFSLLPGESTILEAVWDSDGTFGNNEDEAPIVCSDGLYFGLDAERTVGTVQPGGGFGAADCHFGGVFFSR